MRRSASRWRTSGRAVRSRARASATSAVIPPLPPPLEPMPPSALRSNASIVRADAPTAVDLTDDVGRGHRHRVEEHFAEVRIAGHLAQRAHGHARRVHVDDEHRDAVALRAFAVSARQARGEVAVVRARRPHLLAVEHPRVAVADGARLHAREVGTGARFAEQLAPHVVAAQQRRDQRVLLLVGSRARGSSARTCRARSRAPWAAAGTRRPRDRRGVGIGPAALARRTPRAT